MLLFGAGGHAHVVLDSLRKSGIEVLGIYDHNKSIIFFDGLLVEHTYDKEKWTDEPMIIAIGDNRTRARIAGVVHHRFGRVIDTSVLMAESSSVLEGTMILMGAAIQSRSRICRHVIINTGAVIEHDCDIQDFVHIGPGSVICGNVTIGTGALIGANVTVLPGITIGAWATIGAGTVVLKNVEEGATVAGSPARVILK
jgi:acetyltransferase EpsM